MPVYLTNNNYLKAYDGLFQGFLFAEIFAAEFKAHEAAGLSYLRARVDCMIGGGAPGVGRWTAWKENYDFW